MARSLWKGAISFGLVNVPVRLYAATQARELRFHMLHGRDGGRIHFKRVCSVDGTEVPFEEIVKGYEVSRGRYVRLDPDELAASLPRATHAIGIEAFVRPAEIDPVYLDASYQVVPEAGAARAFALLRAAMEGTHRVAVGRIVLRTRQSLCLLRPSGEGMALTTMLWADEVAAPEPIRGEAAATPASARESEMARQLVEALAAKWRPEAFHDEYREQVLALIHKKAEGEPLVAPPEEAPARAVNLADALAASLAAKRRRAPAPKRAPREAAAAKRVTKRRGKG